MVRNNSNKRRRRRPENKRPKFVEMTSSDDNNTVQQQQENVEIKTALQLLRWAQNHRNVRITVRPVPVEISQEGKNGKPALTLHDMRIATHRGRRAGAQEDKIYARDAVLQKYITRGLTILQVGSDENDESAFHIVTRGFRKFYGLDEQDEDSAMDDGDDDDRGNRRGNRRGRGQQNKSNNNNNEDEDEEAEVDDSELDKQRCDKDARQQELLKSILPDDTTTIVSTSKENGEACHMSAVVVGDDHYWCIGSKNVHLLARNVDDLEHYHAAGYQFARTMADSLLRAGDTVDLKGWHKYLHENKLTANFEFLQSANQHVEPFEFEGTRHMFLTFTDNTLDFKIPICHDPSTAIPVARQYGWEYAEYQVAPIDDLLTMLRKTRDMYRKEGSVFYFLDSKGVVVDMKKVKAIWYVLVRCIREKMRSISSQSDPDLARFKKAIRKTLKDRQSWLKYPNSVLHKWQDIGTQCMEWTANLRRSGKLDRQRMDQFPELWLQFLKDYKLDDHVYPIEN